MSVPPVTLSQSQRVEFLARLRDARALVLRDGESFREASTVLEHIGQVIGGKIGIGLKDHQEAIVNLAKEAGQTDEESASRLFNVVDKGSFFATDLDHLMPQTPFSVPHHMACL